MTGYLSYWLSSLRFPLLLATLGLLAPSCGGSASDPGGTGGTGGTFECEDHVDPFGGPVETPELWDPEQFESGADLGLDPDWAYWEISLAEYGLQNRPAPNPVWICDPMTLQGGEVVMESEGCETLDRDAFVHESDSLIVPVAPSAWLSSDPLNGLYYTVVYFEFGPIPDC